MPQMGRNNYYDNACIPSPSMSFDITVVRLIDGYLGQVMFGGQIVHQTELFQDADEKPGGARAYEAAQASITDAVGKLFK